MNIHSTHVLRQHASLIAIAWACTIAASPAVAQEEERRTAVDALITDEIIVTATKKAGGEDVQDTNIAITAFGGEQLDAFQVRNISDLSFKIPNVQLDDNGTVKGAANFSIRGLGVNSSIPSIDPAVGVFVDGIYLGINHGVVFDTFDLAGVEVLRGPQGVLFGRNVTGGAVLLNTGNPTDEFTFSAKAAVESGFRDTGENYYLQGVVSGPISDGLKGKLGAYYNDDRGWHENLFDGSDFGLTETSVIRGALEYDGVEGLNLLAKVEFGDSDGDGPAGQSHQNGFGVPSFATVILGDPSQTFDRDTFDFAVNERGLQDTEWTNVSFRTDLDVDFGDGTITNIFGYRDYRQLAVTDIDASILTIFHANAGTDQEQYSNEIRYNGRFFDNRLDVTTGLFYFQQDLKYEEQRRIFSADAGSVFNFDGGGVLDHETLGFFASGEYDVTDQLSLIAGVRWSDETKEADIAQIEIFTATGPTDPLFGTPCFIFSGGADDRLCTLESFEPFETSNVSPKIGFGYELDENIRLYGHWSRAFRAGGFNLRNTEDPNADIFFGPGPFEDEKVDSFELGFKSEPVPGARLNGAIFFNTIEDLQREVNVPGGTAVVQQIITNAADAEIFGIELDAIWPVTDRLVLNGSVGYTDGEYTDVTLNLSTPDAAGLALPAGDDDLALEIPRLTPLTASAGFTYVHDFEDAGVATINVNYSHRDKTYFTENNLGFINEQDRVDFSLGFDIADTGTNITVYGKNLTDEVLHGGDTQLTAGTFSPLSKGRVIGVEFNYRY